MEYILSFMNSQKRITVSEGIILSDAMRRAGVYLDSPCGGNGTCGKCTVTVAGADGIKRTVRACRTAVSESLTVWEQTENSGLTVLTSGITDTEDVRNPRIVCRSVRVTPCVAGEKASVADRLAEAMGETLHMTPVVASQLSRMSTPEFRVIFSPDSILGIDNDTKAVYTAAFDIGTTTIAGYLLDENGATVATAGMLNPQTEYGADVISRVDYTMEHGTETLTGIVRTAVNTLLGQLCENANISRKQIYSISVVGNTCMHHLFLGLLPTSLGKAPFSPVVRDTMILSSCDFGIEAAPGAELIMLPVIAGFIGADTVGCAIAERFDRMEKKTLLIDIGTNGELIMGTKDRMIACSTAAGPAFEGAKISMGMRGMNGAIDHVFCDEQGKIRVHVIGDSEAIGICGSGLVDAVSVLLKEEIIDETGRIDDASYRFNGTDVVITQKDIREIQLAKAAIQAGIRLMAKQLNWELEDVEQVLIAGAFGNYMNPDSACDIGLIPEELRGKIRGIGNAAGEGARCVLKDRDLMECASQLATNIEFLELATLREFQDTFVDALSFGEWEE